MNNVNYHLYNVAVAGNVVSLEHDMNWVSVRGEKNFYGGNLKEGDPAYKVMYNKKFMIIDASGNVNIYALNYDKVYANRQDIHTTFDHNQTLNEWYRSLSDKTIDAYRDAIIKTNEVVTDNIIQSNKENILIELSYAAAISRELLKLLPINAAFVVTGDTHGEVMSFAIWLELMAGLRVKGIHLGDVLDYKKDSWGMKLDAWDGNTLIWSAMLRIRDYIHIDYLSRYTINAIICVGNHDQGLCVINDQIIKLQSITCELVLSVFLNFHNKQFLLQHGLIRYEQDFMHQNRYRYMNIDIQTFWFKDNKMYLSKDINSRGQTDGLAYIFPSSVLNKDYHSKLYDTIKFFDHMDVNPERLAEKLRVAMRNETTGTLNPTIVFGHSYDYFALPFHALYADRSKETSFPQAGETDGREIQYQYDNDEAIRKKLLDTESAISLWATVISMDDVYKYAEHGKDYFVDKAIASQRTIENEYNAAVQSAGTGTSIHKYSIDQAVRARDRSINQIQNKNEFMRNMTGGGEAVITITFAIILLIVIIVIIVCIVKGNDIKPCTCNHK